MYTKASTCYFLGGGQGNKEQKKSEESSVNVKK